MIVGFAGAPGVGKSSVMSAAGARLGAHLEPEDPDRFPLLAHAEEGASWPFLNQLDFMMRKIADATAAGSRPGTTFLEVDWVSCHWYWLIALTASGLLERAERDALMEVYAAAERCGVPQPDAIVVLRAEPGVVLQRQRLRGRDYEMSDAFVELTEQLAGVRLEGRTRVPLIEVDADAPLETVVADVEEALRSRGLPNPQGGGLRPR